MKRILVDGDLAAIHLFGCGDPSTPGAAVVDLYRLEDGKIVEHWDVIQPMPEIVHQPASDVLKGPIVALFEYFPNYIWNLSVAIAVESGAELGEIIDMCQPIRDAAAAGADAGTPQFMAKWVEMADKLIGLADEDERAGHAFSASTNWSAHRFTSSRPSACRVMAIRAARRHTPRR